MKNRGLYVRRQFGEVLSRINERRDKIQVIVGPRQVGKSTMMDQVLEKVTIPYTLSKADGVDPKDFDWIHRTWESARGLMRINNEEERLLVIDEIQKIEGVERRREGGVGLGHTQQSEHKACLAGIVKTAASIRVEGKLIRKVRTHQNGALVIFRDVRGVRFHLG